MHGLQLQLPEESKGWWQIFLFLLNSYIEAFVITAVGTRFVFQSVSLEGKSFWVICSSPLSLRSFLVSKFWCWFVPVSIILGGIFSLGSIAINAPAQFVLLKFFSSVVVCCGIVGLGIGLGAYFANFDWEHSTQLAASFGSLVYMLASVGLISINVGFIGLTVLFQNLRDSNPEFSQLQFYFVNACTLMLFLYFNILVARGSLTLGEKSLEKRLM